MLAPKEIYTDWSNSYDTARDVTRQLDYYKNLGTSISNYSGAIKKIGTSAYHWWLHTAIYNERMPFYYVDDSGICYGIIFQPYSFGVSVAFRIG